jgi:hypothetical protein
LIAGASAGPELAMPRDEWVPYRIRFPWTIDEPSVETAHLGRKACRRAQRLLDTWAGDPLPDAIATSRVVASLQSRPRTQVVAVEAPRDRTCRFVLKVHTELESYCRELLAMKLLGDAESGLSARMIAADEAAQALLIEYIEDTVKLRSPSDFDAACSFIGRVHRSLQDFADVLEGDLGLPSARELLTSGPIDDDLDEEIDPAGARREQWLRKACERLADLFGDEIVFCHVGDMKPGHVRQRSGGDWALIDLETIGGPVPQTLDLLGLLNLVVSDVWVCPVSADDWLRGCASYLAATRPGRVSPRDAEHLLEAVQLTAAAFDLQAMLPDPRA